MQGRNVTSKENKKEITRGLCKQRKKCHHNTEVLPKLAEIAAALAA